MKKRLLIGILAASMTMSMGVTAFAAESTPAPENQVSSSTETYAAQKAVLLENARNYYKEKFNVSAYKKANPDLVPIYGDDENAYLEHYLTCGIYEGRRTGTGFDPIAYIINNFEFYMQNGLTGGNSFFNADEFMRWHPQIAADLNNDPAACLTWYLQYGVINGVSSHAKFDVVEFAKKYPDAEARSNITPDLALVADKVEQTNAIIKEKGYDYYINFYVDGTDKVNKNVVVSQGSGSGSSSGTSSENTGTGAGSGTGSESTGTIINNDYPSDWSGKSTFTDVYASIKDSDDEAISNVYNFGAAYILDLMNMKDDELNKFVDNLLNSINLVETKSTNFIIPEDSDGGKTYIDSVKPVEDKKFDLITNYAYERDDDGKAIMDESGNHKYTDEILSYTLYFPINHTEKYEYRYPDGSHSEGINDYKDGTITSYDKYTTADGESNEYTYSMNCNTGIFGFNLYGEKMRYETDDKLIENPGANMYKEDFISLNKEFELNTVEGTVTKDYSETIILSIDKDGNATVDENNSYGDILITNEEDYRKAETDASETDTPEVDAPEADEPEVDEPEADTPEVDEPEANALEVDEPDTSVADAPAEVNSVVE